MSLSYVNNVSAYAVGLRLTMLYQYWTVAKTKRKGDWLLDHVHCTVYICCPN